MNPMLLAIVADGWTLIKEDQTILLWAAVLVVVAISVALEQRFHWASVLSSCILCILGGFLLANLGIIPHATPVFSAINSVVLLCAIPLLLFKANVVEIAKSSGKLFILFHISAVGTILGVMLAWLVFGSWVQNTSYLLTIMGAGCVGGTVNCIAMGTIFNIPGTILDSYMVVGNFCVGLLILLLRMTGNSKFMKKTLPMPHTEEFEASVDKEALSQSGKTLSGAFWGGTEIGLKDIAMALAVTFTIVGVSGVIANWVAGLPIENEVLSSLVKQLFGSVYLIMTLLTTIGATVFHKFFGSIRGSMELGNIGLLMWFVTIGVSGNFGEIIKNGIASIIFFFFIAIVNLIVTVFGAKLTKCTWEDTACANMATIGGPPTVASMAVSFGWHKLVVPGILVGLWGYVIGNYFGIMVGNIMNVPRLLG